MLNLIDWREVSFSFGSSLILLSIGVLIFNRLEKRLDEVI
jgi:ABC-type polysaccharide/polyol phosphate export permease